MTMETRTTVDTEAALRWLAACEERTKKIGDDETPYTPVPDVPAAQDWLRGYFTIYEEMADVVLDDVPLLVAVARATVEHREAQRTVSDLVGFAGTHAYVDAKESARRTQDALDAALRALASAADDGRRVTATAEAQPTA